MERSLIQSILNISAILLLAMCSTSVLAVPGGAATAVFPSVQSRALKQTSTSTSNQVQSQVKASEVNASDATASAPKTPPLLAPYDGKWHFDIAPYLWAINMNGIAQLASIRADLNQGPGDLLHNKNWAAMVWFEAHKCGWGLFLDAQYGVLINNDNSETVGIYARNRFGVYSGGISYEVFRTCFASSCCAELAAVIIEPYVGVRWTMNSARMNTRGPGFDLNYSNTQNWFDPIIGLKFKFLITQYWRAVVAGDVGGTNGDHYSYNLISQIGYKPQNSNATFYVGYRLLSQKYQTGGGVNYYNWDMRLFGPYVGFSISF